MKFRVRCNETNELYDVQECLIDGEGHVMNYLGDLYPEGTVTVELFTGQEDRNGTDIYEGDIVRNKGYTGLVKRSEGALGFIVFIDDELHDSLMNGECEVIK